MKKIFLYGLAFCITCIAGASLNSCKTIDAELDADEAVGSQPSIVLTFETGVTSRAGENDGIYNFNDNEMVMNTVDLFFYPSGATGSKPVKTIRINNTKHESTHVISISNDEFEALFGSSDQTENGSCVVYAVVNVPDADFAASDVVKSTATPADLKKIKTNTPSFATELIFTGGLAMITKDEDGDPVHYTAADKKAAGTVKLKNLAAKIDLLVNFEANVKGVDPNDKENTRIQDWNVTTNNNTPTAEVHILNGVTAVMLSGAMPVLRVEDYYSIRYNDENTRRVKLLGNEDPDYEYNNKIWYATSAPYYSYPNVWEDNPLEQHRTTLLLKVDWTTLPDPETATPSDVLTTYYTVPLALDENKLESNKYYRVKVNINTLGGQNFGEPLELEDISVEVLDWGEAKLEADIRQIRYLEIARKVRHTDGETYAALLNNATYTTIPYHTSHGVEVESVKITYYNIYRQGDDGSGITVIDQNMTTPAAINPFLLDREEVEKPDAVGMYIDPINHTVTLNHPLYPIVLNNGKYVSTGAEKYSRFLIEITLKHVDDEQGTGPKGYIRIMQYPAIYAQVSPNSGGDESGSNFWGTKRDRGWVFVNNSIDQMGGVNGIASGWLVGGAQGILGYSSNPNMYVITVTNLNVSDKPLHLGDPRTKHAMNNLETESFVIGDYGLLNRDLRSYVPLPLSDQDEDPDNSWSATAPAWREGKVESDRRLTFYYPTDETPREEVIYMVAPKFRISSSYGTHSGNSVIRRNNARRRCASYQEDGYPAGRWRLPTVGELQYMAILSQKEIIPPLFSENRGYWTSNGAYRVENGTVTEVTKFSGASSWFDNMEENGYLNSYTRCVYDEWYWTFIDAEGNEQSDKIMDDRKKTFYWGDKPKTNPQDQEER